MLIRGEVGGRKYESYPQGHDLGGRVSNQKRKREEEKSQGSESSRIPSLGHQPHHSSCPQDTCAPQITLVRQEEKKCQMEQGLQK